MPQQATARIPYTVLVPQRIKTLATAYYGEVRGCFDPPVDVYGIAKWLGLEIEEYEFRGRVSGCLVYVENQWVVGVDRRQPLGRRRFTIGHEIAHYLFDSGVRREFYCKPRSYQDSLERRADYFAANLLMPPWWVEKLYWSGWGVDEMAEYFVVSKEAMRVQLRQLRLYNVA